MEEKKRSPIKIAAKAVLSVALLVLSFFLAYGIPWINGWLGMAVQIGSAVCFLTGYFVGESLLPKRTAPFERRLFTVAIVSAGVLMQMIALSMVYLLLSDQSVMRVIVTYIETISVFETLVNWQDPKSKNAAIRVCRVGILVMVAVSAYLFVTEGFSLRSGMVSGLLLLQCIVLATTAFIRLEKTK